MQNLEIEKFEGLYIKRHVKYGIYFHWDGEI